MFGSLISRLARSLKKLNIPYMIIGGQAVLLYGTPRLTRDIDITLGVDTDRIGSIKGLCKALRLRAMTRDIDSFAATTKVFPVEDPATGIRVDFIFSFSEYEKEAIRRARKVKVGRSVVSFASPEDLIIHKIFAGRAMDLQDIESVMAKIGLNKLDAKYIRRWLRALQQPDDNSDMVGVFDDMIREVKRGS